MDAETALDDAAFAADDDCSKSDRNRPVSSHVMSRVERNARLTGRSEEENEPEESESAAPDFARTALYDKLCARV